MDECLTLCETIVKECDCISGCPSCVPPLPPGVESEDLEELMVQTDGSVKCTLSLLEAMLGGMVVVPQIESLRISLGKKISAPPEDDERKK